VEEHDEIIMVENKEIKEEEFTDIDSSEDDRRNVFKADYQEYDSESESS
jgi:hypothetical protein